MTKKKIGRKRKYTPRTKKDLERRTRSLYEATEFEEKRKRRSRLIDESKTAKKVSNIPTQSWFKNPASSDIHGIDTKKYKATAVTDVVRHLQAILNPFLKQECVNVYSQKRAIIFNYNTSENKLKKAIRIRYNNVGVRKRTKKGIENEYYIIVLKHPI